MKGTWRTNIRFFSTINLPRLSWLWFIKSIWSLMWLEWLDLWVELLACALDFPSVELQLYFWISSNSNSAISFDSFLSLLYFITSNKIKLWYQPLSMTKMELLINLNKFEHISDNQQVKWLFRLNYRAFNQTKMIKLYKTLDYIWVLFLIDDLIW